MSIEDDKFELEAVTAGQPEYAAWRRIAECLDEFEDRVGTLEARNRELRGMIRALLRGDLNQPAGAEDAKPEAGRAVLIGCEEPGGGNVTIAVVVGRDGKMTVVEYHNDESGTIVKPEEFS